MGSELQAAMALCQVDVAFWHLSDLLILTANVGYEG